MLANSFKSVVSFRRALKMGLDYGRLTGNPIPSTNRQVKFFSTNPESGANVAYDSEGLRNIVKSEQVVVFMKGVPNSPRCGFSNAVVQVLKMHGVPFQSHDVLSSEELRKNIKDFTSWPTIPQIFIGGEFIGGCDILLEKHQNGELIEELLKVGIKSQILKKAQDTEPTEAK